MSERKQEDFIWLQLKAKFGSASFAGAQLTFLTLEGRRTEKLEPGQPVRVIRVDWERHRGEFGAWLEEAPAPARTPASLSKKSPSTSLGVIPEQVGNEE